MKQRRIEPGRFEQKLDFYYLSSLVYLITLLVYTAVAGDVEQKIITLVWRDPIVLLLALCALVSLVALGIAALLDKRVEVREREIEFATRFKSRVITPEDVEWIAFRRGTRGKLREGVALPAARIKLNTRRRSLWLRPALFEESEAMMQALKEWIDRNDVGIRERRG